MIWALIVAAGKGLRMGCDQRKQYMLLDDLPILAHTLRCFDHCLKIDQLYVVLPKGDLAYCREKILPDANLTKPVTLVAGGTRRQDSVYNGLKAIQAENGIVLIHDGVRPLVPASLIDACIEGALQHKACIPAVETVDTPKQINSSGFIEGTIARETLRMAQTPQAFDLHLIRTAHESAHKNGLQATDDASLIERMGQPVRVIPGAGQNIKITTPQDLQLAEIILKSFSDT